MTKYSLKCSACSFESEEDNNLLHCPTCGKSALLRSVYHQPFQLGGEKNAFYSFLSWLPFKNRLPINEPTVSCVRSAELGAHLGLNDLWVLLSGYAPKYGANILTGTFKETEAIGVISRIQEQTSKTLIISSAGNAARAFLEHGSKCGLKIIVIIPENAESSMMINSPVGETAPLLISIKDSVYMDAIRLVDTAISSFPDRLVREGGVYNIARRDSMAMPFLSAALTMGRIPDRYVQAVGSGTGAIAAYEAAQRLIGEKILPPHKMRLHLVQNSPFQPMVDAWNNGQTNVTPMTDETVRNLLSQTIAPVLSNSTPPYSVKGGIYDVLRDSDGAMFGVTNDQILNAQKLAQKTLGVTPCTAAATALAGLMKASALGNINRNERILLHFTGVGSDELAATHKLRPYPFISHVERGEHEQAVDMIRNYLEK